MSTQQKIKTILKQERMDLWTLAHKAKIPIGELETLMFTGKNSNRVKNKVNQYLEDSGRCPECLSFTRREGGCIHCICGWSIC